MSRFTKQSLATVDYTLRYGLGNILCEDQYLARRVNPWRDIVPPELLNELEDAREGERVSCSFAPGRGVPAWREDFVRTFPARAFRPPEISGRRPVPQPGRFYPQGLLRGLPGVYPSTITPARLLRCDSEGLDVDLNHPLARHGLTLDAHLLRVEDKRSDTGGQLFHWMEELCNWGPGMQLPLPGEKTVFDGPGFMSRADDKDDTVFYAHPRMTAHVDARASENLRDMYARHLTPGMRVLDLMSSLSSHLPQDMDLEVTGLGMNREELDANPLLAHRVVHDLNARPELPEDLGMFDVVVISLSFEYLTQPVDVLASVRRLLAPGGVVLLGTSDRWFPTKAVAGWLEMHEFERMGYMIDCLREAGFTGRVGTVTRRNDWRPVDDKYFVQTRGVSDPVYMVWAEKYGE